MAPNQLDLLVTSVQALSHADLQRAWYAACRESGSRRFYDGASQISFGTWLDTLSRERHRRSHPGESLA